MIGNATFPVPSNDCDESVVASPLTVKFLEVASAVAVAAFPVVLPEEPDTLPVMFATNVPTAYPVALVGAELTVPPFVNLSASNDQVTAETVLVLPLLFEESLLELLLLELQMRDAEESLNELLLLELMLVSGLSLAHATMK